VARLAGTRGGTVSLVVNGADNGNCSLVGLDSLARLLTAEKDCADNARGGKRRSRVPPMPAIREPNAHLQVLRARAATARS
jgi:hypothetical protein